MKSKILIFSVILIYTGNLWAMPPAEIGKTIFASRCAACHNINKVVVGPALANVDQRHNIDWIINFVHSSQSVIKSGNKEAVALFNQFNHIQMPDHPDLSPDDIKSVVEYIKSESRASVATKTLFAKP